MNALTTSSLALGTRARAGFTVVEVMIALTIFLAVLGTAAVVQISSTGLLSSVSTSGHMTEQAQRSLDVLIKELRWAQSSTLLVTSENGSSRLDFQIPAGFTSGSPVWSAPITYAVEAATTDWSGDGVIDEGRLVRTQSGTRTVLCSTIPPGGFTVAQSGNNVTLQLRLARTDRNNRRNLDTDANTSISIRN